MLGVAEALQIPQCTLSGLCVFMSWADERLFFYLFFIYSQVRPNKDQPATTKKRNQAALGLKTLPEEAPWACKRSANQLKRANRLKHPQPDEEQ